MKQWTLTSLKRDYDKDMALCANSFERSIVQGLLSIDLRNTAKEIKQSGRKFTPCEQALLDEYGIHTF